MASATDRSSGSSRVAALDLLRLVAVLAVAFYHYAFWGPSSHGAINVAVPEMAAYAKFGYLGVSIFFIISGFVIAYSAEGRTATEFAIARFSRIYPTFVICMTLTALAVMAFGAPHFSVSLTQWILNLAVAAPTLGAPYVDSAYWSLVVEITFYAWVAFFIATGAFPRRIDILVLTWLALSMLNELTVDAAIVEKVLLADESGFFATGLMIYEVYKGRRGAKIYSLLAVSIGTAIFQAVHKFGRLTDHAATDAESWTVALICMAGIALIYLSTRIRSMPLPSWLTVAAGGLTYPLYLLHQQMGYAIFNWFAPARPAFAAVMIVAAIGFLSWAIWRYVEKPVQQWTKAALTQFVVLRMQPLGSR